MQKEMSDPVRSHKWNRLQVR